MRCGWPPAIPVGSCARSRKKGSGTFLPKPTRIRPYDGCDASTRSRRPSRPPRSARPSSLTHRPTEDAQEAEHPLALSQDAEIFQVYTRHLNARLPNGLKSVQEQGHLLDWSPERWDRALLELSQARLMRARQQDAATSLQGLQERSVDSCDDAQRDWTFCEEERTIFTPAATVQPCSC